MKRLGRVFLVITASLLLAGQAGAAFACGDCGPGRAMTAVHTVTTKYHSLNVAKKTGYSILADSAGITCIAEPQMGAMGVHYVKGDLVKDPAIDLLHPEALVYAPDRHGKLHLAALEYVVIKAEWDAKQPQPPNLGMGDAPRTTTPPVLFGQVFNFTDAPNRYGLPPFYSLHAWIWKENPAGTFSMWNPSVHCDET
jgi:hypothetical protein